jgi:hypothetical protein
VNRLGDFFLQGLADFFLLKNIAKKSDKVHSSHVILRLKTICCGLWLSGSKIKLGYFKWISKCFRCNIHPHISTIHLSKKQKKLPIDCILQINNSNFFQTLDFITHMFEPCIYKVFSYYLSPLL